MKYTNKWMVVPYNSNPCKKQNEVANSLTQVLKDKSSPIDKINEYNQILIKNKEQNHNPVVPIKTEDTQISDNKNIEEDNSESNNETISQHESENDMDISINKSFHPSKLASTRPFLFHKLKDTLKKNKYKSSKTRTAPYSPKKTRGFISYQQRGYLERPSYEETFSNKKRKLVELDKSQWENYQK